jgi:L-ascorbate metabolism protein UlaG (beta-lactamase superfamily)
MLRRKFILIAASLAALSAKLFAGRETTMKIHFIRHATFFLEVDGLKFLIDPMLSAKEAMDPVGNASGSFRIPMVDLPIKDDELKKKINELDAAIITHTHRDHWDTAAQNLLPKTLPLIIQPTDESSIREKGFTNLNHVESSITFKNIRIHCTGGQHGSGEIGQKMGKVSGFVIESNNKRLYIAGDTIWCKEVEDVIAAFKPDFVVVNAGAAQFLQGDPITMSGDDVVKVCRYSKPSAKVIAVHMETVNHCLLKRGDLKAILESNKQSSKCVIPADGETILS